jgi:hypothetical protein
MEFLCASAAIFLFPHSTRSQGARAFKQARK